MNKLVVTVLAGRKELKLAMAATRGKMLKSNCKPLSDKAMREAIVAQHGSLNKYIFHVRAKVTDRVHGHLRTHHLVNEFYQCSSSRPDLEHCTDASVRIVDFYLPMKRLIEISQVRLCLRSWDGTIDFFRALKDKVILLEPALESILQPTCVHKGYCPEAEGSCGYARSGVFKGCRDKLLKELVW